MDAKHRFFLQVLAFVFLLAAAVILVEQYITWGVFFEAGDFLHHENFAVILVVIAMTIVIILAVSTKQKKRRK